LKEEVIFKNFAMLLSKRNHDVDGVVSDKICRSTSKVINNVIGCGVEFNFLVPIDLDTTPYVIISSHGRHSHPPPPPRKTPQELMEGVLEVIKRLQSPTLNLCKFLSKTFAALINIL
jgi:hypothetical protein